MPKRGPRDLQEGPKHGVQLHTLLGAILETFWALLGPSWNSLGAPWALVGPSRALLVPSGGASEPPQVLEDGLFVPFSPFSVTARTQACAPAFTHA